MNTPAPLSKAQALKKYDKATRLRWRSPISEWRAAFPTVESLAEFRRDVGHICWPENYGQSCWDDAFSLAHNLGEGLSENSRAFMLENAETVTGKQVLAVHAEYGLKVAVPAPVVAPVAASVDLTTPESALAYLQSVPADTAISLPSVGESTIEGDAVVAITGCASANEWALAGNGWEWKAGELVARLVEGMGIAPAEPSPSVESRLDS